MSRVLWGVSHYGGQGFDSRAIHGGPRVSKKTLQAVGLSAGADASTNPARECRHVAKARDRIGYGKNTRGELRTIQRTIGIIW